jgi:large subunit ribosomal protein L15
MLQPHTIKPARGAKKNPKKVGRGNASGHGTSSTRGGKGQTARSGGSRGLKLKAFKKMLQSTPKLRGFKSLTAKPSEVYLSDLEKHFASGDTVTIEALQEKNILRSTVRKAKIVQTGTLTKKLTISGMGIGATKSAQEKITAVGGSLVK